MDVWTSTMDVFPKSMIQSHILMHCCMCINHVFLYFWAVMYTYSSGVVILYANYCTLYHLVYPISTIKCKVKLSLGFVCVKHTSSAWKVSETIMIVSTSTVATCYGQEYIFYIISTLAMKMHYVIVISHYEWYIIVITRHPGKAKVECNSNDMHKCSGI